jgi:hypothetical protein
MVDAAPTPARLALCQQLHLPPGRVGFGWVASASSLRHLTDPHVQRGPKPNKTILNMDEKGDFFKKKGEGSDFRER